ncbi:hypothetical protein JOM49_005369 [Amycolatopsis magusensis]|uniref:Uncharacterized protein n=1 Tax=Amycolatopsis magusensis TaxID=882444 RepID=A0ABS4PWN4_9PSEU|nr:hypothetical protein [Amycolatopsis magusensis]
MRNQCGHSPNRQIRIPQSRASMQVVDRHTLGNLSNQADEFAYRRRDRPRPSVRLHLRQTSSNADQRRVSPTYAGSPPRLPSPGTACFASFRVSGARSSRLFLTTQADSALHRIFRSASHGNVQTDTDQKPVASRPRRVATPPQRPDRLEPRECPASTEPRSHGPLIPGDAA